MAFGSIFKVLIFCCLVVSLEARPPSKKEKDRYSSYLMKENHPIKRDLDDLFSSDRILLNLDTLETAGFLKAKPRKFTKLIVTKHPLFPGYVFKLYLDSVRFHEDSPEYHFWILRVQGAERIRHEIETNCLETFFKVPKKWIYELPEKPQPKQGYFTKYTILVEEDMDILPDKENQKKWASDEIKQDLLESLYHLISTLGLRDCTKPQNIPFSSDGRIAFVDTQSFHQKVEYEAFLPFLSKQNRKYWKQLIKENHE